ncbi:MAG: DUF4386 domain-containing protein [Candidatus Lokiarchaeota archaeon]|nr:DUF4386 domain-containing protein [Candidatus Lokiarchaeota archaeon]
MNPITIEMSLSGFLFLFILVLNIAMAGFGKKIEIGDYDLVAKLQNFNNHPKKFKISILLGLVEHVSIIMLAIMLFVVFSPYNIILGMIWLFSRIGEGLIFIYNEIEYRKLLNIARKYTNSNATEKDSLINLSGTILQTDKSRYNVAIILFSIGTLAYSILFVIYGVVPSFIGWLGILTAISLGLSSALLLVKPNFQALLVFGLLAIAFEILIGGWLLIFSFSI